MTTEVVAPVAPAAAAAQETERIYRAAVQRVLARAAAAEDARRNYGREKLRAQLEGRPEPPQPRLSDPRVPAPTTVDEWVDDMLTRTSLLAHDPIFQTVCAVLEAARQGRAAAAAAVHRACGLRPLQQYLLLRWLSDLAKESFPRGAALVQAAIDEFRALGLAAVPPAQDAQRELGEWLDDQIAQAGDARGPAATVVQILEGLRAGPAALAAAVAAADHLSAPDRAAVEAALRRLPVAGPVEIHNAQREALTAWVAATRRLASKPPGRRDRGSR
jgi:hypothetical protein